MRASSAPPCSSTGEPRNPHNALHGGGENRTRVRSVATTSCWKACVASDSGLPGRRFGRGTTSLAFPLNPRFAGPERGANDSLACSPPVRAAGRADQASSRSKVIKGSGARARQPVGVQTMRAGGSSPRLTAVSTGLRPCVRRACRVSSATEPVRAVPLRPARRRHACSPLARRIPLTAPTRKPKRFSSQARASSIP